MAPNNLLRSSTVTDDSASFLGDLLSVHFGCDAPPSLKEERRHTSILSSGKFTRGYNQCFVNSAIKTQSQRPHKEELATKEDEIVEEFRGMVFTGSNGGSCAQSTIDTNENRSIHGGNQYGSGRNGWKKNDRRSNNNHRSHNHNGCEKVLTASEAEDVLSFNVKYFLQDNVDRTYQNQHQFAVPETLVWKLTTGKLEKHFCPHSVCPNYRKKQHYEFSKEEVAAEQYRTNLLYRLICENGISHVEDLYRKYLQMNVMEPYPFDGFNHFHKFIADRAHIFGMDRAHMVYNESLLVTLAVQRYAHALLHGTPVEKAPDLFKSESAGLFYRAFLAYMRKARISFEEFFQHFPAIFVFDNVWALKKESASKIPSVFRADCVPERDTTRTYVDRSQLFSGVGVVLANNIAKIKIQSSECLRKGMPYFVSVPIDIVDDRAKYPIGAKVSFTAVRLYNDGKDTVQGTSIRLETEQIQKSRDGTIPDFWSFEEKEECLIDLSDDDDNTTTVVKEIKTLDETRNESTVRTLDIRATIAASEHKRQAVMLRLAKDGIEVHEKGQQVLNLFPYGYDDYLEYLEKRPFLFDVQLREDDGAVIIKSRLASVRKIIQDYICSLTGKDGRSISKVEAILMCSAANESLPEEDRFSFNDLKGCIRMDRLLFTKEDGRREFLQNVQPLFYWNWQHKIMMCM